MKHILAVTSALLLTGCSTSVTSEPPATTAQAAETTVATTTAPTTTTTTQPPVPETRPTVPITTEPPMNGYQPDLYLEVVKEFTPYWYYSYTDDVLLELAHLSCQSLDEGTAVERLLFELMAMVDDVDTALNDSIGAWLRSVVRYICPEHFPQIG